MSPASKRHVLVLVAIACVLLVRPAVARAQDVVEVASGDTIRGEVRRLEHGRLDFRTPRAEPGAERWAGTISIVWSEVKLLAAPGQFEVELTSGEWIVGSLETPSPRKLVIRTSSGPSVQLDLNDIVRILPLEHGFRARTVGSLEFGLALTREAQTYSLGGDATHRSRNHAYETDLSFNSWLLARDTTDNLTRNDVNLDLHRRLANHWYAMAIASGEQDEQLELDARFVAGGGIGRRLIRTNMSELSVEGGLNYDGERYKDIGSFDHSAELFAGVDWNWFAPGHAMDANADATTFISMARARARLELEASVKHDVIWDIYGAVRVVESFDGAPPIARPKSNFVVTFTLGWTF